MREKIKSTISSEKKILAFVAGIILLTGSYLVLFQVAFAKNEATLNLKNQNQKFLFIQEAMQEKMAEEMANDLKEDCKMTDEEIKQEGLTRRDVKKVREFCSLSKEKMEEILKTKIKKINNSWANNESIMLGYTNSYSCWTWYGGYNWGIPNYGDLGLTKKKCKWHDVTPSSCKIEGKVACLWGCTKIDPRLKWHRKIFSSQKKLENVIYKKGYHKTKGYAAGNIWQDYADRDYTRGISYGYRYQISMERLSDGRVRAHSEGPEPNPESNWYGYTHGFWPDEVFDWHHQC